MSTFTSDRGAECLNIWFDEYIGIDILPEGSELIISINEPSHIVYHANVPLFPKS